MDNNQGDLTDIVRASGGALTQSDVSSWEFPSDPLNLSSSSSAMEDNTDNNVFGDPFINIRDPLLHELNVAAAGSSYFNTLNSTEHMHSVSVDDTSSNNFSGANSSSNVLAHHKVFEEEANNNISPCNMFSRIQISPNNPTKLPCDSPVMAAAAAASSPQGFKPSSSMVSIDMINANSSKTCLIDNTGTVQISSPRNLGIKRRKSQAKKVVCIPAPAPANSRPSGEVVPSDLWAWRKYGQKPIKGSPYPRGYYRCSSSKGCSARKQVERSRTDPNMLVITYTSEHNHPWPTQRNALAGSTRSQPPKNNNASASLKICPLRAQAQRTANTREEQKENSNDTLSSTTMVAAASSTARTGHVKEEVNEDQIEKQMEMRDIDQQLSSEGFPHHQSRDYTPAMADCSQSEDFFADLGEIEADPLDLLFSQDFSGDEQKESKALDPFGLFDWSGNININISNNNSSNIPFGEAKRG